MNTKLRLIVTWAALAFPASAVEASEWRFCVAGFENSSTGRRLARPTQVFEVSAHAGYEEEFSKTIREVFGESWTKIVTRCDAIFDDRSAAERGRDVFIAKMESYGLATAPITFNFTTSGVGNSRAPSDKASLGGPSSTDSSPSAAATKPAAQPENQKAPDGDKRRMYLSCDYFSPDYKTRYFSLIGEAGLDVVLGPERDNDKKFKSFLKSSYGFDATSGGCSGVLTTVPGARGIAERQYANQQKRFASEGKAVVVTSFRPN